MSDYLEVEENLKAGGYSIEPWQSVTLPCTERP